MLINKGFIFSLENGTKNRQLHPPIVKKIDSKTAFLVPFRPKIAAPRPISTKAGNPSFLVKIRASRGPEGNGPDSGRSPFLRDPRAILAAPMSEPGEG